MDLENALLRLHLRQVKEIATLCQQASHSQSLDVAIAYALQRAPALHQPDALYPLLSCLSAAIFPNEGAIHDAECNNRVALLLQLVALNTNKKAPQLLKAALTSPKEWDAALAGWFTTVKNEAKAAEWHSRNHLFRAWVHWKQRLVGSHPTNTMPPPFACHDAAGPKKQHSTHVVASMPNRQPGPSTTRTDIPPGKAPFEAVCHLDHAAPKTTMEHLVAQAVAILERQCHLEDGCNKGQPQGAELLSSTPRNADMASQTIPPSPAKSFPIKTAAAHKVQCSAGHQSRNHHHTPEKYQMSCWRQQGANTPITGTSHGGLTPYKPPSAQLPQRRCPGTVALTPGPSPTLVPTPSSPTLHPEPACRDPPISVPSQSTKRMASTVLSALRSTHCPDPVPASGTIESSPSSPTSHISFNNTYEALADQSSMASVTDALSYCMQKSLPPQSTSSTVRFPCSTSDSISIYGHAEASGLQTGASSSVSQRPPSVTLTNAWDRWHAHIQHQHRNHQLEHTSSIIASRHRLHRLASFFGAWHSYSSWRSYERHTIAQFAAATHQLRSLAHAFRKWQGLLAARRNKAALQDTFQRWKMFVGLQHLAQAVDKHLLERTWAAWRGYVAHRLREMVALEQVYAARDRNCLCNYFACWRTCLENARHRRELEDKAISGYQAALQTKFFFTWWEAWLRKQQEYYAIKFYHKSLQKRVLHQMRLATLKSSKELVEHMLCQHLTQQSHCHLLRKCFIVWRCHFQQEVQIRTFRQGTQHRAMHHYFNWWRQWTCQQLYVELTATQALEMRRCKIYLSAAFHKWKQRLHAAHLLYTVQRYEQRAAILRQAKVFHRWRQKAFQIVSLRNHMAEMWNVFGSLRRYFQRWKQAARRTKYCLQLAQQWHARRLLRRHFTALQFFCMVIARAAACRAVQYSSLRVLRTAFMAWLEIFLLRRRTKARAWHLQRQQNQVIPSVPLAVHILYAAQSPEGGNRLQGTEMRNYHVALPG